MAMWLCSCVAMCLSGYVGKWSPSPSTYRLPPLHPTDPCKHVAVKKKQKTSTSSTSKRACLQEGVWCRGEAWYVEGYGDKYLGLLVSWCLGLLVSWFIGSLVFGWYMFWGLFVSLFGFLLSWLLGFKDPGPQSVKVSKIKRFRFRMSISSCFQHFEPILPKYHSMFFGIYWSHIQDFQDMFGWFFVIVRCRLLPKLQNCWFSHFGYLRTSHFLEMTWTSCVFKGSWCPQR